MTNVFIFALALFEIVQTFLATGPSSLVQYIPVPFITIHSFHYHWYLLQLFSLLSASSWMEGLMLSMP